METYIVVNVSIYQRRPSTFICTGVTVHKVNAPFLTTPYMGNIWIFVSGKYLDEIWNLHLPLTKLDNIKTVANLKMYMHQVCGICWGIWQIHVCPNVYATKTESGSRYFLDGKGLYDSVCAFSN